MQRDEVIAVVREMAPALREQGVAAAYLFGSFARKDSKGSSDIDIAFDLADDAHDFSLIDQARLQRELSSALGRSVDLVERAYLRPRVAHAAKRDFIQIF